MNIPAANLLVPRRATRGVSLFECLVYISLVTVVLGIATAVFYKCWDAHRAIRRNADDIVRALHAGERWRADIRAATGRIQLIESNGVERLRVPGPRGGVVYSFADGEVRRQANPAAPELVVLSSVKSSRMKTDARQIVTAWQWDLELKSNRKDMRLRPLFTFEAVTSHQQ
jgi:Tfp pilus assembly protein FimT